jgi:hypothetical protein
MVERTNQEWLTELRGPGRELALADLRALLVKGLHYAMADRPDVTEADLEDFAQDALLKILAGLDTFRGESRFTTRPRPGRFSANLSGLFCRTNTYKVLRKSPTEN